MARRGLLGVIQGTDGIELEAMSDDLLRYCNAIDEGIFTELQLTRQDIAHADSMERVFEAQIGAFASSDDLVGDAWADIQNAAYRQGVPRDTIKMINLRRQGYAYEQIAVGYDTSADAVRMRIERAKQKIQQLPEFGMWETIIDMLKCEKSWWLRYFWELMELAERGAAE